MKKSIFKVGDKVFDIRFGWGVVYSVNEGRLSIDVSFGVNDEDCYTWDGRAYEDQPPVLSFTEYTFEGFSQERPEELPKKGQIVWGRKGFTDKWYIGHFFEKCENGYLLSLNPNPIGWHRKVVEITIVNPYKDE